MNTRAWASGVYLSTALLAATVLLLFQMGAAVIDPLFPTYLGWMLAALVVLAGLMLTDFPLAVIPTDPARTVAYLAARIRFIESRVKETNDEVRVQLGGFTVARFRVRPANGGSLVSFRADLTPAGLGFVLIMFVLTILALAAIPVTIGIFLVARRFSRIKVAPLLPADGRFPEGPRPDDIADLLVGGVAEAHRLAAEAYDAERSSYMDIQGLAFLGTLAVWAIVLIAVLTQSTDPDFGRRIWSATYISLAAASVFEVGVALLVRSRFRPRLLRFRGRVEALRDAWSRLVARVPEEAARPSSFELLADSVREVPDWVDAARGKGFARDPGAGLIIVALVFWAAYAFPLAALAAGSGQFLGAILVGLAGIALTVGVVLFYRRWEDRQAREATEEIDRWNRRYQELHQKMERFLQEL